MRSPVFAALGAVVVVASCGGSAAPRVDDGSEFPDTGAPTTDDGGGSGGSSGGGDGAGLLPPNIPPSDDPTTCVEAAASQSYVGCDYWPTVLANNVWSIFDYAVVVANAGTSTAQVTVTGPGGVNQMETVAPGALTKIYLPWVKALKGADADSCGDSVPLTTSTLATGAAYHLVSSVPVIVTQFNALEYKGAGGPAGKSWASCPGNSPCTNANSPNNGQAIGCYSFSNDSSLLLPSTALTGNARIVAYPGESAVENSMSVGVMGSTLTLTGVVDATHVKVFLSGSASIVAGTGITATPAGDMLALTLNAGDVAQLVTALGDSQDLSGTLVQADQPVQVITGAPCDEVPEGTAACDHLEQSVFPAETLGKQYFVTVPTTPTGKPVGHVVRMVGNVDGTLLAYAPSKPSKCPTTLNAGQVVDCGIVTESFEVTGSSEFVVASFQLGGSLVDPNGGLGDPSQSLFASVEQYRVKYVFLAPNDYSQSWMDVVLPIGTQLWLDGNAIEPNIQAIAGGYAVARIQLSALNGGRHTLESAKPVGVQVMGYGEFTSYQYPGGLNLALISPPPVTQ
jgi:hypothetical protein